MWLLMAAVQAFELAGGLGYAQVVNDPFFTSRGLSARLEARPLDWLGVGATGGWYPYGGIDTWSPLSKSLLSGYAVAPDVSAMNSSLGGVVTVSPFRGVVGSWSTRVGLSAGIGAVHTSDDLEAFQAQGEPRFEATRDQFHLYGSMGLFGEVRRGAWGGRLRMDRMSYVEVIGTETTEDKNPVWLGVDLAFWPQVKTR